MNSSFESRRGGPACPHGISFAQVRPTAGPVIFKPYEIRSCAAVLQFLCYDPIANFQSKDFFAEAESVQVSAGVLHSYRLIIAEDLREA
jgi:hypothetical protein